MTHPRGVDLRWIAVACRSLVMAPLVIASLTAAEESGGEHAFVGSQKCAVCHEKKLMGDQYDIWKAGPHAKAFATLGTDEAALVARAAGVVGDPQMADQCLRCHVTGHGAPAERLPKGKLAYEEGVGCESCHGAGKDYRNKQVMSDPARAEAKGMKKPVEADCRACHNESNPTWNAERYTQADGRKAGFDFDQALAQITHAIPVEVKGRYLELEKQKP